MVFSVRGGKCEITDLNKFESEEYEKLKKFDQVLGMAYFNQTLALGL